MDWMLLRKSEWAAQGKKLDLLMQEVWQMQQVEQKMEARIDALMNAQAMKKEQILEGLAGGPEEPAVRSVMAIVKGLRQMAVNKLAHPGTEAEMAAMLRGHLAFASAFEEMLGACWGEAQKEDEGEK
jgi:hypothetical protein